MATEIERKFLVTGNGWRKHARPGRSIRQAYLASTNKLSMRVRIIDGAGAYVTIKGKGSGLARTEYEYAIPVEDARALMRLRLGRVIIKRRHVVVLGKSRFEVDVFAGEHRGLIVAEIELPSRRARFERPPWLGKEVTGNKRYYNSALAGA